MKPIVANTPIPASSSNELLARPATMAEPLRSERRRRYDEYVIMMPKPTDREKKICPYACTHTVLSVMADQSGEKKALRPSSEPGRVSALITRATNSTTSRGMKILLARSMPRRTPAASTPSVMIQTAMSGIRTGPTYESPPLGASVTWRNSPKRNPSGSPPHAVLIENPVYMTAHAMMTA